MLLLIGLLIATFIWGAGWKHRALAGWTPGTNATPGAPQWQLVYKEGRATKTVRVTAPTEDDALLQFIRQGHHYDRIISFNQVTT